MFKVFGMLALCGALFGTFSQVQAALSPQVFSCQDSEGRLNFQLLVSPDPHGGIAAIHLIQVDQVLQGYIEVAQSPQATAAKGGEIVFTPETEGEAPRAGRVKIEFKRFQSLTRKNLLSPKVVNILYREEASPDSSTPLSCNRRDE